MEPVAELVAAHQCVGRGDGCTLDGLNIGHAAAVAEEAGVEREQERRHKSDMDETYLPVFFKSLEAQMENDIEYNKYQESCDDYKGYHYPSAYLRCVCYKIYYQRSGSERGNHAEHEVENGASSGEAANLGLSALEHEKSEHEECGDENCPENIGSQRWRGPFFCCLFCHSFNGR